MKLFFKINGWIQHAILKLRYHYIYSKPFFENTTKESKILVSYITRPFYDKSLSYRNSHQNVIETLCLRDILKEFSYQVQFHQYDKKRVHVDKYDIIFGIEPLFLNAVQKNPESLKIYYATGAYFEHQNSMIMKRTDEFNEKHKTKIPYRRLALCHNSVDLADHILQIGSQNTLLTYPEYLRSKIKIINQSSYPFEQIDLEEKARETSSINFLWFGSGGTILKGVDLIVEYFLLHPQYNLHLVGPLEEDVLDVYRPSLDQCKNIFLYGFMDISNQAFRNIANKCAFIIFPSASEGCPGSVINAMKLGLIPLTSKWASPTEINELGFQIDELNQEWIDKAVCWSQSLSKDEILSYIHRNHLYVMSNFNIDSFRNQLENYFSTML